MNKDTILVSEHFYSIQGEGPTTGVPAVFLRLGGCNLLCGGPKLREGILSEGATWLCDSEPVWRKGTKYTIIELLNLFDEQDYVMKLKRGAHLIITGGEPMIQDEQLVTFLKAFDSRFEFLPLTEMETNGTLPVAKSQLVNLVDQWNISPKLSNSGMPMSRRITTNFYEYAALTKNTVMVVFKFVVSRPTDIAEIEFIIKTYGIGRGSVWLMPAGSTREDQMTNSLMLVEHCKDKGYRFSTRLHVHIWNQATGV